MNKVTLTQQQLVDGVQRAMDDKNYVAAENMILQWIASTPQSTLAWLNLGVLYREMDCISAAKAAYERALLIEPDSAQAHSNYGNLLCHVGETKEAVKMLQKACKLAPESLVFKQNLVYALRDDRQFDKAIKLMRELVRDNTADKEAEFKLGFILLHNRELEEGWELYEKRPKTQRQVTIMSSGVERYAGKSLKGKSLLVVGEQGFGDTILMTRFLVKLQKQADNLTLITRAPLIPLIEPLGITCLDQEALPADFDPKSFDFAIEMKSIIPLNELDWCKWPSPPKLTAPEASVEKYKGLANTPAHSSGLKVGIIWSGSVTFRYNYKRAAAYTRFMELMAKHANVEFFSFQKGPREEDMQEFGRGALVPLGHTFQHFGDSVAALEHMDLVLMTDSGIAHLAGTIGVPVINMLNYFHYWLYNPIEDGTPLYKSMRFLRQKKEMDWDSVFKQADNILGALAKKAEASKKRLSRKAVLDTIDKAI